MDDDRARLFASMGTRLTMLSERSIRQTIRHVPRPQRGWGSHGFVRVGGRRVFVKRIPLTPQEYRDPLGTRNHYNLPPFYNYGLGSAGSNAWREVVAATKATNWVLSGEWLGFPLLFHYRVLPSVGRRNPPPPGWLDNYVRYWGGRRQVRRWIVDRAVATHEVVLFFEHLPQVLGDRCSRKLADVAGWVREVRTTAAFLRAKGVCHFDCHPWNVLIDEHRSYLADFGLVLDHQFDLTSQESAFLRRNTYYDEGTVVGRAGGYLMARFRRLGVKRRKQLLNHLGVAEPESDLLLQRVLVDSVEDLTGKWHLPERYVDFVVKHRHVINLLSEFDRHMMHNRQKDDRFNNRRARQLLDSVDT